MSGRLHSAQVSSPARFLLKAWLGLGLALAAGPALAGGTPIDCVLGSKEAPSRLIAVCTTIVDNPGLPALTAPRR